MPEFVLDKGGTVFLPLDYPHDPYEGVTWDDLTPFERGYVGAMLTESRKRLFHNPYDAYRARASGFRDLAPETLAMVRRDCEAMHTGNETGGRMFWGLRKNQTFGDFPPLAPYLGDDGKVYLS